MILKEVAITRDHKPIWNKEKNNSAIVFTMVPIRIPNISIVLFPIASKVTERGDSKYSIKKIGANTLKKLTPLFVL